MAMKVFKNVTIDATPDKVWDVFAHNFDAAGDWMASVPKSAGAEVGERWDGAHSAGRVCDLTTGANPIQVSERFLAYDEANKTCTVEVVPTQAPRLMPFKRNVVEVGVLADGTGGTDMNWVLTSTLSPHTYVFYPLFKLALGVFVRQIQEELKHFVETGEPHPRKVKAMKKLAAQATSPAS
jgi:hypothetical protein